MHPTLANLMGLTPGGYGSMPVDPRMAGRRCLAIPDGTFVVSVVFFAMIFTYFVIPMGLPNASLFQNGIPGDGYSIGSTIFHWFALLVALTLYYPRSQRIQYPRPLQPRVPGAPPSASPCLPDFYDDEVGNSMQPITTVMITYAVVKAFSFVTALASRDSAAETQRLLRTVLALAELIIIYMYVYNMSENARQKVLDQRGLLRPMGGAMGGYPQGYPQGGYNQQGGYYDPQNAAYEEAMYYQQQHPHYHRYS